VQNCTGGTTTFSGTTKALNTGANTAVTLTSNTGHTINFSNGGLAITTTSGIGFNATLGATAINVTGPGNTISSGTGKALNVASTTIGASGLMFQSISANGAANGIVLNGTGANGGLSVTGTGAASSGGTIQNTSGAGISLSGVTSPSFASMNIQNTGGSGIAGAGVVNFTFVNGTINNSGTALGADDSNIAFNTVPAGTENNVSGVVTITGNNLTLPYYHGVDIINYNGTISSLNISSNTITSATSTVNSKGSGILIQILGSASTVANLTKATILTNVISNFPSGAGIVVHGGNSVAAGAAGVCGTAGSATDIITITGNRITGQSSPNQIATAGIEVAVNGKGQGNFNVSTNGTLANPLTNVKGNGITCSAFGQTTVTATINNNVIVANNTNASQGIGVGTGRTFSSNDVPTLTVTINNNTNSQTDGNGILVVAREAIGHLNVTIKSNNVAAPLGGVRQGIRVDAGNSSSADDAVCLDISGNKSAPSVGQPAALGIGLRKQGTISTTNDFGVEGMAATSTPGVEAFINGLNPSGGGTLLISATSGFSNCSSAP